MNSTRRVPLLAVCLFISMSLCPLFSASAGTSLWGKKLEFNDPSCMWQLKPEVVVPALKELTTCVLLRHTSSAKWTGFVYKAPHDRQIQLGIGGSALQLDVWLFGEKKHFKNERQQDKWYSICLTWSGRAQRLRIFLNGARIFEDHLNPSVPKELTPNGTLTLGVSHFVHTNGEVIPESGNNLRGSIGLFRMWGRELNDEELKGPSCAEGDVMRWDQRHWKSDCPPELDSSLQCAWTLYKIKLGLFIVGSAKHENYSVAEIIRTQLKKTLPSNISVQNISVSPSGQICHGVNDSVAVSAQQPQGLEKLPNSTCEMRFSCEVHVDVNPADDVKSVQKYLPSFLNFTLTYDFLVMTVDPNSILIFPVDITNPTPTISSPEATSEGPKQTDPAKPGNISTTKQPSDLNHSTVRPDLFFRVNLTIIMMGGTSKPKDLIEKWVKEQLEVNKTKTVLNFIAENRNEMMEKYGELLTSYGLQKEYFCTFQVQEVILNSVPEIEFSIHTALTTKFENGSITIHGRDVSIKQIETNNCLEEVLSTIYGQYIWPETFPQYTEEIICNRPTFNRAFRLCKLNGETDITSWADPDMTNCDPLTIIDISNVTVTPDNAAEVVDVIQDLVDVQLSNSSQMSSSELGLVVGKLNEVVNLDTVRPDVGADIADIVGNILLSETDVTPVANTLLKLTDRMGNCMDFQGEIASISAPSLALSMVNVGPGDFSGLTCGISLSFTMKPEIVVNQSFVSEVSEANATISLPSTIYHFFPPGSKNTTRVLFQFYGTEDLFKDPYIDNATQGNLTLNSYIVSASINNSHVIDLEDPVVVILKHKNPKQPGDRVHCVFWDFQNYGGQGGWNSRGCEAQSISPYQTSCLCNHLTHFALLLDVSRVPISEADSQILTVISYIGCGISAIFLGITLLTYLFFEKLRQDYPSKILINLSVAMLGLNMLFLLNSWFSSFSNHGLCITTAALLHYFLLASFTWMGLEAVHMYLALVKVFNTYVRYYILKFCAVGWGMPLLMVILLLAIDKDAYGNLNPEEASVGLLTTGQFCWIQNDIYFYVTVMAFVFLILLFNISVFIIVLIQIRRMSASKLSANCRSYQQNVRAVISLSVLLGLTWSMGFFSFGPGKVVMMYLFSICNTLQGFFVFVFHCLLKENAQNQWRSHLCCERFKLSGNSDWSQSVTAGDRSKKEDLSNSDYVTSDNTSSLKFLTHNSTRRQE
ncbi:adhesion G-protein coupled receptor G6 isoform 2-T2 [Menidia menidia]